MPVQMFGLLIAAEIGHNPARTLLSHDMRRNLPQHTQQFKH